jgi:hypothetical protein
MLHTQRAASVVLEPMVANTIGGIASLSQLLAMRDHRRDSSVRDVPGQAIAQRG